MDKSNPFFRVVPDVTTHAVDVRKVRNGTSLCYGASLVAVTFVQRFWAAFFRSPVFLLVLTSVLKDVDLLIVHTMDAIIMQALGPVLTPLQSLSSRFAADKVINSARGASRPVFFCMT
jgi:hypothetical protein